MIWHDKRGYNELHKLPKKTIEMYVSLIQNVHIYSLITFGFYIGKGKRILRGTNVKFCKVTKEVKEGPTIIYIHYQSVIKRN
jgi:hypothetical protein